MKNEIENLIISFCNTILEEISSNNKNLTEKENQLLFIEGCTLLFNYSKITNTKLLNILNHKNDVFPNQKLKKNTITIYKECLKIFKRDFCAIDSLFRSNNTMDLISEILKEYPNNYDVFKIIIIFLYINFF